MELIDTDLFENQFEKHRDNITYAENFDENKETRQFVQKVAKFYNQSDEMNAECFKITRLNRYYAFRKIE